MPSQDEYPLQQDSTTLEPRASGLGELLSVGSETAAPQTASLAGPGSSEGGVARDSTAVATPVEEAEPVAASMPGTEAASPAAQSETDGAAQTAAPAAEQQGARPARLRTTIWDVAGVALMSLGAFLFIAPFVSVQAANLLAGQGDMRMHSTILIVVGLLVFATGFLRRTLSDLQQSLQTVRGETARIQDLASEELALRDELQVVRLESIHLSESVATLQAKITDLTVVVSHPEHTASIFRLANGLDQHGRRIENFISTQLDIIGRQVEFFAKDSLDAAVAMQESVGKVDAQLREQGEAQELALIQGLCELDTAGRASIARFEARLDEQAAAQQTALRAALAGQSEQADLRARRSAEELNELRTRIEQLATTQAALARDESARLERRIELAEKQQLERLELLTEQVRSSLAVQLTDLQQDLRVVSECASSTRQSCSDLEARVDDNGRTHLSELQQLRWRVQLDTEQLASDLVGLREVLDQRLDAQAGSLRDGLELVEQRLGAQGGLLGGSLERLDRKIELAEQSRAAKAEQLGEQLRIQLGDLQQLRERARLNSEQIASDLADLRECLGQRLDAQASSLRDSLERLDQKIEITEQLRAAESEQLGEQLRTQLGDLQQLRERARQDSEQFAAGLGGLRESLDQRLDAQAGSLSGGLERLDQKIERAELAARLVQIDLGKYVELVEDLWLQRELGSGSTTPGAQSEPS
jgi:hypothetical protein